MNSKSILRNSKLTAAQKSQIATVEAEVDKLHDIIIGTSADLIGRPSKLHRLADLAMEAFEADCTLENAERYHAALLRCETAEKSGEHIAAVASSKLKSHSRSLAPIAEAVIDSALNVARAEISKARASLASDQSAFDLTDAVESKGTALIAALEGERSSALQDPLRFLVNSGHSVALL